MRLRAHVRRHQGVPDAGVHVRHIHAVDDVRGVLFCDGNVRRVRIARDDWQNSRRNH